MGPRLMLVIPTMFIMFSILLGVLYEESPAFREAAQSVETCAGCGTGSLELLVIAVAVGLVGVTVSWWRGGGRDGDA